jgi:transcriptional regulator with XRE-family HTH domain
MEGILNKHIKEHQNSENEIYTSLCFDFVDEVHTLLEERGWSQKDLADRMGKSPAEVSKLINGMHNVTFRTIAKLSDAFGVDLIYTATKAAQKYKEEYIFKVPISLKPNKFNIPDNYDDYSEAGKIIQLKIA